jgi:hypothetical protein
VYREDDFIILGHQEDWWLGYTEVFVSYLPRFILKVSVWAQSAFKSRLTRM